MDYSRDSNMKKRRGRRAAKRKMEHKLGIIIFRVLLAAGLVGMFAFGGAAVGAYFGIIENAPKLDVTVMKPSIYPSVIYYGDGTTESARLKGEENREYVAFDKVPQYLKDAFVAIEDERFYTHNGVDMRGMARALYTNLTTKRTEGASTITQQLIKNNVNKIAKNNIISKLQEQYLAVEYEKRLSEQLGSKKAAKDHILEIYMNSINMHYSLNGVQTAAQYYFNKSVSELTLSESAVIAAITQNPSKNAPIMNPENNRHRQELVLDKMLELGMVTEAEYKEAYEDDVYSRVSPPAKIIEENNSLLSYFNDALLNAIVDDLCEKYNISTTEAFHWAYNGGFYIYGTQDAHMQGIMDESYRNDDLFPKQDFEIDVQYSATVQNGITGKLEKRYKEETVKSEEDIEELIEKFRNEVQGENDELVDEKWIPIPQPQSAMVIIDYHNGQVKALTGGRGEKMTNLALNRAVDSTRQPGSVFKVLASYAPSIDLGVSTPATVIDDSPFEYNGWSPRNWYGGYRGLSTVRQGITNSMNVITVKNMYKTGIDECFRYLINFGFTTLVGDPELINGQWKTDKGLATCLGGLTNGVTQLEVAAAYGTMANLGEYNKPIFYTKVLDHDGSLILENTPAKRQVLKKQAAYLLTDMMKDVITQGTGGKARFKNITMPLAGKTGTTTDTYDLTFVGYTPYYVAGIWLGFDQPKTIREDAGYHMYLWSDIMEKIHADLPVKEFEKPEGIVTATICGVSGKLSVSGLCTNDPRGSAVRTDLFMAGTQPSEYCDIHISATIDKVTRMKAGPYCPVEYVETVVGILARARAETGESDSEDDRSYEIASSWIDGPACTIHGSDIMFKEGIYIDADGTIHAIQAPESGDEGSVETGPVFDAPSSGDNSTDEPPPVVEAPVTADTPVQSTPVPESPPPEYTPPEQPVMDQPQSLDNFAY